MTDQARTTRYYDAAWCDDKGLIHPFGGGFSGKRAEEAAADLCEALNSPNPRKPHPDRVWFVAFQDRPDWQAMEDQQ